MTASGILPTVVGSPRVSVVICTRDRADKIGAAVLSVLSNDHPDFDLTVIDQSRTGATQDVLQSIAQDDNRLKYIHLTETGLSRAYNTGIRGTTAPLLAFTDDDCIVPQDWLRRIDDAFTEEPIGELLYGQVVPIPQESQNGSSPEHPESAKLTPGLEFAKPERLSRRDGFRIIGMGANFAARRRLFDRIGDFDEALGGGGPLRSSQDFDLTYRAFRSGAAILLRPEVTLIHDGGREPEDWPKLMRSYGIGDGAFYSKHVRCGDMYALMLLLRNVLRHAGYYMLKVLRREHPSTDYLTGVITGIREGRKFSVDRSRRRYAWP